MRKIVATFFFFAMLILFAAPVESYAQASDTVLVPSLVSSNINGYIMGDTLANGDRVNVNRVYKLERNKIYWFDGTMYVDFPLTIVGAEGDTKPPVIAPRIRQDNSAPGTFVSISSGNATFKNLYLLGIRPDGIPTITATEPDVIGGIAITLTGQNLRIVVDNCVFDGWSWEAISYNNNGNKFFITDSKFRNLIHSTSWFYGEAFRSNGGAASDTVYMTNNTFFSINGYVFCPVYYNKYFHFEHNTVFLNGVNPFFTPQLTNAVIKNNIFYGTLAQAQTDIEVAGGWFDWDAQGSSTIGLDTLSTVGTAFGITEAQRSIQVKNNAYYWPQKLQDFWNTALMDTLTPPVWMNNRTNGIFTNNTTWPAIDESGNQNVEPEFPSAVMTQVDSLIKYVQLNRQGGLGTYEWSYKTGDSRFNVAWPVPENLAYANTALQSAGDDGYALGDLNWFPSQREQWHPIGVNDEFQPAPESFALYQAYPNPFNPSTNLSFSIREAGNVSLKIYDVMGREVMTLINNEFRAKGDYKYSVNMSGMSSGVYFYRLQQGAKSLTKKMALIK
ncbi:MAG TPA: T9SS type A sorting domain-containing protein [Ignavibacteriales bacterium]|nr:T9SS type A sorting domain-containing protein [Ignavibacteriales bacterium]